MRLVLASRALAGAASLAVAGIAVAQNTSKSDSTGDCPSQQTLMTSDRYGSTKGYLCASGNATINSPVVDKGNGTATAIVALDSTPGPVPTGATLTLVDANAKNPKTGDRIVCRSSANAMMLDAGDTTSGPCQMRATG